MQQFSWVSAHLIGSTGMAMINGELATVMDYPDADRIAFLNPTTGAFIRSIPNPIGGSNVEAMAYDGSKIWLLGTSIVAVDPNTGAFLTALPNPAFYTLYHGTGLAVAGPNQLMVVAPGGEWYRVSTANGAVINAGNNLVDMYDLTAVTVPEPGAIALCGCVAMLSLRRRR